MLPHVNQFVRTAYFHLWSISRTRRLINYDTCASVVQALVISRLDYANAVLIGLPENALHKLQLVQNSAARMITKTRRRDHMTPILKRLHWLPVHLCIVHKVLCLVYKAMTFVTAPIYIKDMLELYRPARDLRSCSKGLQITVPRSYRWRSCFLHCRTYPVEPAVPRCSRKQDNTDFQEGHKDNVI